MPRSFLITNKRYKGDGLCQGPPDVLEPQSSWGSPDPEPLIWTPPVDHGGEDSGIGKEIEIETPPSIPDSDRSTDKTTMTCWQEEISRDYPEPRDCSDMASLTSSPSRPSEMPDVSTDFMPEPVDFSIKSRTSPPYDVSPTYFPSLFSSVVEERYPSTKPPFDFGSTFNNMSDELVYKSNLTQLDYSLNALVEKAWGDINVHDTHVCPECGKRYSTSSNLARHRQTHRSMSDKKARKCPHCDKVYVSMPAFSMHVRTHNQGCECPYCGKRFSRPWLLQGHIRTHTGEKPFKCPQCTKAFADKSNLRAHVQTHSTEKPFSCGRCGKAFALKSYLYKHEESSCMRGQHQRLERSFSRASRIPAM